MTKEFIDHLGIKKRKQLTPQEQAEHKRRLQKEYNEKARKRRIAEFEADLDGITLPPEPKVKRSMKTKKKTNDIISANKATVDPIEVLLPVCTLQEAQTKAKERANQQKVFTRESVQKVRMMAAQGMLQKHIAFYLGVNPTQWLHYKAMYPDLAEAVAEGYREHEMKHLGNLDAIAERGEQGAVQASIFKLKATHSYTDKNEMPVSPVPHNMLETNEGAEDSEGRVVDTISQTILSLAREA